MAHLNSATRSIRIYKSVVNCLIKYSTVLMKNIDQGRHYSSFKLKCIHQQYAPLPSDFLTININEDSTTINNLSVTSCVNTLAGSQLFSSLSPEQYSKHEH